jgi:hypothetical protein
MFEYYYFNFNIYSFIQENKRKRETENKQEAQQKQSLVWKICCCETLTIFSEANELFPIFLVLALRLQHLLSKLSGLRTDTS